MVADSLSNPGQHLSLTPLCPCCVESHPFCNFNSPQHSGQMPVSFGSFFA